MKRTHTLLAGILATAAIAAVLVGSAAATGGSPVAHAGRVAKLQLKNTELGKILVETSGFTVYRFSKDSGKANMCVKIKECSGTWPALTTTGRPTAGPGVSASLLSTITLSNGSKQVTYAGHPLYRYSAQTEHAETSYAGAEQFGGKWFAVSSSGKTVK
jgi:predicted lipoprotein with Yx(FWY)xxD motif